MNEELFHSSAVAPASQGLALLLAGSWVVWRAVDAAMHAINGGEFHVESGIEAASQGSSSLAF
ncbi:MAG TPA: hypothetical protein DF282_03650 [Hyphomonas sp.]|nr:hypothetical protein [Hyphomonas sp.]HCE21593.1 hypothetical protein [Hyphomonas sp.]